MPSVHGFDFKLWLAYLVGGNLRIELNDCRGNKWPMENGKWKIKNDPGFAEKPCQV
jgi:hypothetical protein